MDYSSHLQTVRTNFPELISSLLEETEFDLLISYYDIEKPILMLMTQKSKAKFKVGFASVDKHFNRWMINTSLENYKLFISELFRYLKNIK